MGRTAETFKLTVEIDLKNKQQLQELIKQLNDAAGSASNVGATTTKVNKGLKKTQIQSRQTGRAVQNFSYQLQDMIVQISGGVDPLRSMSQQLPQMLINMGALGGVIGVVAAGLPILIQYFKDADGATKTWDESLASLAEVLGEIGTIASRADYSAWAEEFNKVGLAAQNAMQNTLDYQISALRSAAKDAADAVNGLEDRPDEQTLGFRAPEVGTGNSITGNEENRLRALSEAQKAYASSINLTVDEVETLVASLAAVKSTGGIGSDEETQTAIDLLQKSATSTGEFTEKNKLLMDQLIETQKIQVEYAEITRVSAQAAQGYGSVLAEVSTEHLKQNKISKEAIEAGKKREEARKKAAKDAAAEAKEAARQSADFLKELDRQIADSIDFVTRKDKERARLEEEHAKRRMELWKLAYPEVARYAEAVAILNEQEKEGIITTDAKTESIKKLKGTLDESLAGYSLLEDGIDIFQQSFDTMLDGVLMGTQNISDGFRAMAKVVVAQILKIIAYNAIFQAFGQSSGVLGVIGQSFNPEKNADGNAFSNGNVIPFAKGGIVSSPTIFPMAKGGIGLMGEGGSPEAIMPLSRGADGKLGVSGGGVNVTINNLAPGVQVQQRETEQGLTIDVVMKSLSQAISQGGNDLSTAMEGTYSLGRGRSIY